MDNNSQEHENESNNPVSFLAGLLIGGMIGAGTMLLLAPQSGKRTRAKIQQTGIELRDQTSDALEDTMAKAGIKARQIRTGARKQAKVLQQQGQSVIDESKKRWSTIVEAGKTTVKGTPA